MNRWARRKQIDLENYECITLVTRSNQGTWLFTVFLRAASSAPRRRPYCLGGHRAWGYFFSSSWAYREGKKRSDDAQAEHNPSPHTSGEETKRGPVHCPAEHVATLPLPLLPHDARLTSNIQRARVSTLHQDGIQGRNQPTVKYSYLASIKTNKPKRIGQSEANTHTICISSQHVLSPYATRS